MAGHTGGRRRGWRRSIAGGLACILLLTGCVMNRARGRKEFSLVSEAQEQVIGQQGNQEILRLLGTYDEKGIEAYVQTVGRRVGLYSDDPGRAWQIRVIDSPVVNAFALPGGYIYVTRGLLAYLENEAQLAVILAHEMAHTTARHVAQGITRRQLGTLGLILGSLAYSPLVPYLSVLQTGLQLLFLHYGRDAELEADRLAVRYASAAGYAVSEAAPFFQTLERLPESQPGSMLPGWASTHPTTGERIAQFRQRAQGPARPGVTLTGADAGSYLFKVAGMVYGTDPRRGFVEAGTFYHPELRFRLPVPKGWKVGNFASQVRLVPESRADAVVAMTMAPATEPEAAAENFLAAHAVQVLDRGPATVSGLAAYRLASRTGVTVDGWTVPVRLLSYFVRKGDRVFVFHAYAPTDRFSTYAPTFELVITGFAPLVDQRLLARQPHRLAIVAAPQPGPLRDLVSPNPAAGIDMQDLAVLNQREAFDPVPRGTLLKIVR